MNIKKLLLIVGIANAVVLGVILALFIVHNGKVKTRTEKMINIDQALLLNLNEMYAQGLQTGQATRNVLINPNDEKAKNNYKEAHEIFVKANDEAIKLSSGKIQNELKKVKAIWEEDHKLKTEVQGLAGSGKRDEAIALLTQKETSKWREVRSSLLEMMKEQKGKFKEKLGEDEKAMRSGTTLLIAIILLSLIGFSAFLFIINKTMQKNMANALECFTTLERGELKEECRITDESNFLKDIYNKILMTLRGTMLKISSVAGGVTHDVSSLAERINTMDTGAKEQLSQIDHVASATTEMSQTIIDVAKNASFASEAAKEATSIAGKGKDTVKKAVDAIIGIAESVKESSRTIEELGKGSQEIGEIVAVINDIADQTNLLALNAAIEAARAGEQGRGFAVVADEVRKLAERTAKATSEISGMIKAIQDEVESAVVSMNKGTERVEVGVEYSTKAGEALNKIVNSVEGLHAMVQQIASATEEMSTVSETISGDIETIASVSKETSSSSEQIAQSSSDLARLASNLQGIVGQFRV